MQIVHQELRCAIKGCNHSAESSSHGALLEYTTELRNEPLSKFVERARMTERLDTKDEREALWRQFNKNLDGAKLEYAADIQKLNLTEGHLLDMNKLENFLLTLKNRGVDTFDLETSLTYVASEMAIFSTHVEDMNLYSSNILLAGGNKTWVVHSPEDDDALQRAVRRQARFVPLNCREFFRHKLALATGKFSEDTGLHYSVVRFDSLNYC